MTPRTAIHPNRTRAVWLKVAQATSTVLALTLTACTANTHQTPTTHRPKTATDDSRYYKQVYQLTDGKSLNIDKLRLPTPPPPFDRRDIASLATHARTVMQRSFAPPLSDMSARDAFQLVMGEERPETLATFIRNARRNVGPENKWEWVVATRFAHQPQPARIVNGHWSAKVIKDTSARPYLALALQVVAVQTDRPGHPVITQRSVHFTSYNPTDATSTSGFNMFTKYLGTVDACRLVHDAVVIPQPPKAKYRTEALKVIRQAVTANRVEERDQQTAKLRASIRKEC